jgi:hypothetical protein
MVRLSFTLRVSDFRASDAGEVALGGEHVALAYLLYDRQSLGGQHLSVLVLELLALAEGGPAAARRDADRGQEVVALLSGLVTSW